MTEHTQTLSTTHSSVDSLGDKRAARDQRHDLWFRRSMMGAALLVLFLLISIAGSTLWGGSLAFRTFGLDFLTSTEWDAVNGHFGAVVPIYGTLVTSFLALLIAVPVSFGIAIFLTEVAPPWLRMPIASAVELLAGIPSIIYGMWGLFVFGPFMAQYLSPWINDYLGALPLIGSLFQGPPLGIG
ncbi:phosphate ABC transporter permease subunit PstC, partial [Pseudomonas sp. MH10out]|nr:phosphate ABC transporter permease subunit PstC [Pseudomonas sp. MH10out]